MHPDFLALTAQTAQWGPTFIVLGVMFILYLIFGM